MPCAGDFGLPGLVWFDAAARHCRRLQPTPGIDRRSTPILPVRCKSFTLAARDAAPPESKTMNRSTPLFHRSLTAAILVGLSGFSALTSAQDNTATDPSQYYAFGEIRGASVLVPPSADKVMPYLVQFDQPPVVSAPNIPRQAESGRVDVRSAQARAYAAELSSAQDRFLADASQALGRSVKVVAPEFKFQHALNGMAIRLNAKEAGKLAAMSGVASVTPMQMQSINTDRGPTFIGADKLWNGGDLPYAEDRIFGATFDEGTPNQGEGIVVGDIDTGLNFDSPSFAETDERGYTHTNPLGASQYLGLCDDPGSSTWTPRCNAKVIGAYDFIAPLWNDIIAQDPGATDGPGPQDEQGHGTHTASTAAGNHVHFQIPGGPNVGLSGVAPHANIVVFNTCYANNAGNGSCPNISTAAAVDRAVADGVVDALNYSISGGVQPWSDPTSRAFLGATEAGIFVAAAAGNNGPGAGSVNHSEPWVTTVAASTHDRRGWGYPLHVTGPDPVPAELMTPDGAVATANSPIMNTPVDGVMAYDDSNRGYCTAPAAGSLATMMAVIRRGSGCSFNTSYANAVTNGGAVGLVIMNHIGSNFNPTITNPQVPIVPMSLALGDALVAFYGSHPQTTLQVEAPKVTFAETPDEIAAFSSRGPAPIAMVKPDIAAPGVNILAAISGLMAGGADGEHAYGLLSGTSMAAPHVTGAAALLRKAHPDWTPSEIKSAMMLTAKSQMLLEDGVTAAGIYDTGSGRIRVDVASKSGLLMDESALAYALAVPSQGGDPTQLNVPSVSADHCVGTCSFSRRFRSTQDHAVTWTVSGDGVGISPASFTVAANATVPMTFDLDMSGQAQAQAATGDITLTPDDAGLPTLHMPYTVFVDPPTMAVQVPQPNGLFLVLPAGQTGNVPMTIRNTGNAGLEWSLLNGNQVIPILTQAPSLNFAALNTNFINSDATERYGVLDADDLTIIEQTRIRRLHADGYMKMGFSGINPDPAASMLSVNFSIYGDDAGRPAGFTIPNGTVGDPPVWTQTVAVGAPGLSINQFGISLDLDTAGATLDLPAGKYWIVVQPNILQSVSDSWRQFLRDEAQGSAAKINFNNDFIAGVNNAPPAQWVDIRDFVPGSNSLAMAIDADRECGVSWATTSLSSDTLGADGESNVQVLFDTTGLAAGRYAGRVCIQSNGAVTPFVAKDIIMIVQ